MAETEGLPEIFQFRLLRPDGVLLETEAREVIVPGDDGYFGVRPGHHPMLALVGTGELTVRTPQGSSHHFALSKGFCDVGPTRVVVLAEVAEAADEIDVERTKKLRDRALQRLQGLKGEGDELEKAQQSLESSQMWLEVASRAQR